jgi:hypothetical protein
VTASKDSAVKVCDFVRPHIGSSGGGGGFGAAIPDSQCPCALSAQQGIELAELFASGIEVSATALSIKSATNRPTREIVKERTRFICE